jgi:hypothetical protein
MDQCKSSCHELAVNSFPTSDPESVIKIRHRKKTRGIDYKVSSKFFEMNFLHKKTDRSYSVCAACIRFVAESLGDDIGMEQSESDKDSEESETKSISGLLKIELPNRVKRKKN